VKVGETTPTQLGPLERANLNHGILYNIRTVGRGVLWTIRAECYKQDKTRVQWAVWQSPASKDVNTYAEEETVLEVVTRWQPVKIQQTEKT
jgi:hypothetical protein